MSDAQHIGKVVGQIIQGHTNKVLDKVGLLDDEVKRMAELRFADCLLCEHTPHPTKPNQNGPGLTTIKGLPGQFCNRKKGGCGCEMEAKTKVKSATCPIGRW